jgi:hypothetical protein
VNLAVEMDGNCVRGKLDQSAISFIVITIRIRPRSEGLLLIQSVSGALRVENSGRASCWRCSITGLATDLHGFSRESAKFV